MTRPSAQQCPNVARGTHNAVWFIESDDGVQWVFRTPHSRNVSSCPYPGIIDCSVSQDNTFDRPYIIMERVKGVPLQKLWFDPVWFSDEKREMVFKSLASNMSQLQVLEFKQIGSILYKEGNYVVGPLLPSYNAIANWHTDSRVPYNSVHSFLMDTLARSSLLPSFRHLFAC